MLGFDPLPHIPLPVDPRSLLNTTTGSSSNTAAVDAQGHDSQQMMTVGDEDVKAFEVAYAKARSIKVLYSPIVICTCYSAIFHYLS